jgi:hypothetical protein
MTDSCLVITGDPLDAAAMDPDEGAWTLAGGDPLLSFLVSTQADATLPRDWLGVHFGKDLLLLHRQ